MILLETKRLIVRPVSIDSLKETFELYSDPEVMLHAYNGPKTYEETCEFVKQMIQHHEKHGFSSGNVYEKGSNLFIGRSGLIFLGLDDNQPEIEVGYILHKKFWNKGYATELATAFLEWGFKNLSVNKLVATVNPKNIKSRHVLEKIGMSYFGDIQCWGIEVAKYEIFRDFKKS